MDSHCQDAAHPTNGLTEAVFKRFSQEDEATYRRWARAVLAFYSVVFLLLAIGIGATQMMQTGNTELQASLRPAARFDK